MERVLFNYFLTNVFEQEWELFIGKNTTNVDEGLHYKDSVPKWINDDRAFDVYMLKVNSIIYIIYLFEKYHPNV